MTTMPSTVPAPSKKTIANSTQHWLEHQTALKKYDVITRIANEEARIESSPVVGSLQISHGFRIFSGQAKLRVQKLFSRFREISELRKNWNGYNADPIPAFTIKRTAAFLFRSSQYWPYFDIFPTAADSIQLELHCTNGDDVEIEISQREATFCIFDKNGACLAEKEFEVPKELAYHLTKALEGKRFIS
jgi:hypothetical protein